MRCDVGMTYCGTPEESIFQSSAFLKGIKMDSSLRSE
jgi:hypothetical protein